MKAAIFGVGVAIFALCGCGRPSQPAAQNERKPDATAAAAAVIGTGTAEAPREVRIQVGDNMKFSVTRIEAAAGETLRVLLVNTGTSPKEAMGHNWVLLRPGVDVTEFSNAAVRMPVTSYIPQERESDVIAHTKLLGGGQRDAVVFQVPADAAPGTEFTYLCTFPAHFQLGMKGVLVVK